jgi:hypothetical protein
MNDTDFDEFLSKVHHTLRATRRRYVVQLMDECEDPILTVRSLARRIAAREHSVPHNQATGEPYRNAYNALSQTHLPTLADAEIIIYDSNRQTVSAGEYFDLAILLVMMTRPAVALFYDRANLDELVSSRRSSMTD